ncbi:MAG: hypothetical protein IAE85_15805 [Anaerolinea sp.]|nr:hypothetical protein [Anaerolinea sp.]
MTDIAIRVDNLSKLCPARSLRAGHLGALQQRHDTLRDALTGIRPRITRISRRSEDDSPNSRDSRQASGSDDLWTLKNLPRIARRSEDNSPNSRNSRQASGSDDLWTLKNLPRIA